MSIVRVPYPNSLPTVQTDYVKQNNLIEAGFLMVNKPKWTDGTNILKGNIFQIGGTPYQTTADEAITGGASDYIKLTPSGDGSTAAASYVADLTGVTWSDDHNGYYDVSGNLYVFDELKAIIAGDLASANTRLWEAFVTMLTLDLPFSGNNIFSINNTFNGDNTFNGIQTVTGKVNCYKTNEGGADILLKTISGVANVVFDIKNPISARLSSTGTGGTDATLDIYQNGSWRNISTAPTANYGIMLNPGRYRLSSLHILDISTLYCSGVYSLTSIIAGDIVT